MSLDLISLVYGKGRENTVAAVNPIQRGCVDHIDLRAGKPGVTCPTGFEATIWFYAGKTKAWHEVQGKDLPDLVDRVNEFIAALP